MCFGNDAPPAPVLPPPPPPPEMMDVIDEISGVQAIVATDANGKKRRLIQRLPRTPEEEERYQLGTKLFKDAIGNITSLYQYDPSSVVSFAPLVETMANLNRETMQALGQVADIGNINEEVQKFRQMQNTLMEEDFARVRRETDSNLIKRGISDSTSANEFRAALAKNEVMARQEGDIKANMYGEDLASRRLNRNAKAFALQQMGRDAQFDAAKTEYGLRREQLSDLERKRLQAIEENKGILGVGSSLLGQDMSKALQSNAANLANQTFAMQSADSLNRYNADVNRTMANYRMATDEYNSRGPSFGDWAMNTAGMVGGAMLTSHPSSLAGRWGSKLFG